MKEFGFSSYAPTEEEALQKAQWRIKNLGISNWEKSVIPPANNGCDCDKCTLWRVRAVWEA